MGFELIQYESIQLEYKLIQLWINWMLDWFNSPVMLLWTTSFLTSTSFYMSESLIASNLHHLPTKNIVQTPKKCQSIKDSVIVHLPLRKGTWGSKDVKMQLYRANILWILTLINPHLIFHIEGAYRASWFLNSLNLFCFQRIWVKGFPY